MTTGIVPVAFLALWATGVLAARMTSTLRRNSSAASSGSSIIPSGSKAPLYDDVLTFEITQLS